MGLIIDGVVYSSSEKLNQSLTEKLLSICYYPLLQGGVSAGGLEVAKILVVRLMSSGDVLVQLAGGTYLEPRRLENHLVDVFGSVVFARILPSFSIEVESPTLFWDIVTKDSPGWYR